MAKKNEDAQVGDLPRTPSLTASEALAAPEKWQPGLKVKGAKAPFGGRWTYDPQADELTLVE